MKSTLHIRMLVLMSMVFVGLLLAWNMPADACPSKERVSTFTIVWGERHHYIPVDQQKRGLDYTFDLGEGITATVTLSGTYITDAEGKIFHTRGWGFRGGCSGNRTFDQFQAVSEIKN